MTLCYMQMEWMNCTSWFDHTSLWNLPLHISMPYHTRHSPCACLSPHCLTLIWILCMNYAPKNNIYTKRKYLFKQQPPALSLKEITLTRAYLRQAPRFSASFMIQGLVIAKYWQSYFILFIFVYCSFYRLGSCLQEARGTRCFFYVVNERRLASLSCA